MKCYQRNVEYWYQICWPSPGANLHCSHLSGQQIDLFWRQFTSQPLWKRVCTLHSTGSTSSKPYCFSKHDSTMSRVIDLLLWILQTCEHMCKQPTKRLIKYEKTTKFIILDNYISFLNTVHTLNNFFVQKILITYVMLDIWEKTTLLRCLKLFEGFCLSSNTYMHNISHLIQITNQWNPKNMLVLAHFIHW